MEAAQRMNILKDVFTEQLIHWGLARTRSEIEDVVERLVSNVDPERSHGAHGRSQASADVASEHQKVFLHYFDMPEEQARALSTALVMWEVITEIQNEKGDTDVIPLSDVEGLDATRRHRFLFINDEWLPRSGGITTFNAGLSSALATEHHVGCYLPNASDQERALAKTASTGVSERLV